MSKFFGNTHTMLERDLSKRDVLHLVAPLVSSQARVSMRYHHIRDVSHTSDTIHHIFTFQGVNLKILWWHAYNIRIGSKQAWCAASFGAIGLFTGLRVHEISLYSWGFARFRHYTSYIHIPRSKSQNSSVTRIRNHNAIQASVMCCIFWRHWFLHRLACSWNIIIFVMFRTVQTLYIIYSHSKE